MRRRPLLRCLALATAALAPTAPTAGAVPVRAASPEDPDQQVVAVQLLAINDLHGSLEPTGLYLDPATGKGGSTTETAVPAGGAAFLASHLRAARARNPNTLIVSAGDLVGASPLVSGYFHDEPTVEVMNRIGLDVHAVGNHEFDEGYDELRRLAEGGCHPVDGCRDGTGYAGAGFEFLAANVTDTRTGRTVFPAYTVRELGGARIAFIGLPLAGTPDLEPRSGLAGLSFADEVRTVKALVPQVRAAGADAVVVLLHGGATQTEGEDQNQGEINSCAGITGPAVTLTEQLDDAVDVVVSGHTHKAYECRVGDTLLTSASSHGRVFTALHLTVSPSRNEVRSARARNIVVTRDLAPDGEVSALVDRYRAIVEPIGSRVVGNAAKAITRGVNDSGESALSNVVADAQYAATRARITGGAQVAMVQRGVLRADLEQGELTYEQAYRVQPYGHRLVTMTLTGAQLDEALEQQFCNPAATTPDQHVPLLVSGGFRYSWDDAAPCGERVRPGDVLLRGEPITPTGTYRVTVNEFLAEGGERFHAFRAGTDRVTGPLDVDVLVGYLGAHNPISAPARNRVTLR
jgi:5'-nucleotidase